MNVTILKKVTVDVRYIEVIAPVRCDDDLPFIYGDIWRVKIELESGRIVNCPEGQDARVFMKIRDSGTYRLLDYCGEEHIVRNWYVPSFFPGDHWGDYIIFDVKNGVIQDWSVTKDALAEWAQEAWEAQEE